MRGDDIRGKGVIWGKDHIRAPGKGADDGGRVTWGKGLHEWEGGT